jgi:hypothetical protein
MERMLLPSESRVKVPVQPKREPSGLKRGGQRRKKRKTKKKMMDKLALAQFFLI